MSQPPPARRTLTQDSRLWTDPLQLAAPGLSPTSFAVIPTPGAVQQPMPMVRDRRTASGRIVPLPQSINQPPHYRRYTDTIYASPVSITHCDLPVSMPVPIADPPAGLCASCRRYIDTSAPRYATVGRAPPAPRCSVEGVPPAPKSAPVERVPPTPKPASAECALPPVNDSSSNKDPGLSSERVRDEAVQRTTAPIRGLAVRVRRAAAKVFGVMCCQLSRFYSNV